MKRLFYLLFFCFIGFVGCDDGSNKTKNITEIESFDNRKNAFTLKDYNLKGKIDSVHRVKSYQSIDKDFNITQTDSTKQLIYHNSYHFNKKGQLLKTKYFYDDSSSNTNEYHIISENGKLIDFVQEGEMAYYDTIIKNTESELTQICFFDDTLNSTLYWLYRNDRLSKDSIVLTNGEIEVYNYIYNQEGLLLKKEKKLNFPDPDKYLYHYKYLDFDENGNWTKRIEYNVYDELMKDSSFLSLIEERTIFYTK